MASSTAQQGTTREVGAARHNVGFATESNGKHDVIRKRRCAKATSDRPLTTERRQRTIKVVLTESRLFSTCFFSQEGSMASNGGYEDGLCVLGYFPQTLDSRVSTRWLRLEGYRSSRLIGMSHMVYHPSQLAEATQ